MPEKTDILDALIAIAIILFILSVIVEKITQLIRRYSPFIKPKVNRKKNGLSSYWRNIKYRQTGNTAFDKKIEREVTSLSFVIGSLIALAFKVDLFKMISASDPRTILFWKTNLLELWENHSLIDILFFIISIFLTGFFLSFGSKFFHDLIDTLLQVKNLKSKLSDKETYKIDSIDQLDDYLNKTHSDIIQTAIDQNRDLLQVQDAVSPPLHGKILKEGRLQDCIDIHLKGDNRGNLPQTVQAKLSSSKIVNVIVHAIYDVEIPTVLIEQGDTTANEVTSSFKGTVCCRIKRNGGEFLLTCSHVYTGGTSANHFGTIEPAPAQIDGKSDGDFKWAICTDKFDLALLTPQSVNFEYKISPEKERKPVPSDIMQTKVKVVCQNNKIKDGIIVNDKTLEPVNISYKGGNHSISDLIVLSDISITNDEITYSRITIPGDSGACVYADNKPIGMIIAGNNKFSYAIPIVDILYKLTAQITK